MRREQLGFSRYVPVETHAADIPQDALDSPIEALVDAGHAGIPIVYEDFSACQRCGDSRHACAPQVAM